MVKPKTLYFGTVHPLQMLARNSNTCNVCGTWLEAARWIACVLWDAADQLAPKLHWHVDMIAWCCDMYPETLLWWYVERLQMMLKCRVKLHFLCTMLALPIWSWHVEYNVLTFRRIWLLTFRSIWLAVLIKLGKWCTKLIIVFLIATKSCISYREVMSRS